MVYGGLAGREAGRRGAGRVIRSIHCSPGTELTLTFSVDPQNR